MRTALLLALLAPLGCDPGSAIAPDAPPHVDAAPRGQGGPAVADVVINEVAARESGPDWIELKNRSSAPVDLSGWFVSDAPDRLHHYHALAAGTVLAAGDYLVLSTDALPFSLSREDGAFLVAPDGLVADGLVFLAAEPGTALARVPDGEGLFFPRPPTRGAANLEVSP